MKIGPRYKICKRLGGGIFEKCQTQKFQLSEARSKNSKGGRGFKRGMSDYGRQLIEKQKVRFSYGITEKKLRKYVTQASGSQDAVSVINTLLETRLDNVVYRAGFAKTRRMARQLVAHGHITVNGRKNKVPSHIVSNDDVITIRDSSKTKTVFSKIEPAMKPPKWMTVDIKKMTVTLRNSPEFDANATIFDYQAVFEYYSR
jgi:small subunit ribosomal protein S4